MDKDLFMGLFCRKGERALEPSDLPDYRAAIDRDLEFLINDELDAGETTLLSDNEIDQYLKIYREDGHKRLASLEELKFGASCRMSAPLFSETARGAIKRISQGIKKGKSADLGRGLAVAETEPRTVGWIGGREGIFSGLTAEPSLNSLDHRLRHSMNAATIRWDVRILQDPPFMPPHLHSSESLEEAKNIWGAFRQLVLEEAWVRAMRPQLENSDDITRTVSPLLQELEKKYPPFKLSLRTDHFGKSFDTMTFNVDADECNKSAEKLEEMLGEIINEIEFRIRQEVLKITTDHKTVSEFLKVSELMNTKYSGMFNNELPSFKRHIDSIRELVETDELKINFLKIMNMYVIRLASFDRDLEGVTVELIPSEDLAMGYEALYRPRDAKNKQREKVQVALSVPGTVGLMNLTYLKIYLLFMLSHHKEYKIERRSKGGAGFDLDKYNKLMYERLEKMTDLDQALEKILAQGEDEGQIEDENRP